MRACASLSTSPVTTRRPPLEDASRSPFRASSVRHRSTCGRDAAGRALVRKGRRNEGGFSALRGRPSLLCKLIVGGLDSGAPAQSSPTRSGVNDRARWWRSFATLRSPLPWPPPRHLKDGLAFVRHRSILARSVQRGLSATRGWAYTAARPAFRLAPNEKERCRRPEGPPLGAPHLRRWARRGL